MNILFANLWVLALLWLVPIVGVWWFMADRNRRRRIERLISPLMQKKLCPPHAAGRFRWQAGLVVAGLMLLLLAAARPQWGTREVAVYQRGRDLVIALDVSRSMLARDVHPNRLQRAKADILDLIRELRGDRAALLAFRYKGVLLCPLTTDYAYLRHALDSADVDSAPRGETDIGDAILKALDAFETDDGAHKAIVLISDGEDLTGQALQAAAKAKERGIPIFTVGLGSPQGAKIPDESARQPFTRYKGDEVVTRLNNEALHAIAEATGGAYIAVQTASTASTTLGVLYRDHLRNVTAQDLEETLQRRHVERYQVFLLPSVVLMLAGCFFSRGRLSASAAPAPRPDLGLPGHGAVTPADRKPPAAPKDISPAKREPRRI